MLGTVKASRSSPKSSGLLSSQPLTLPIAVFRPGLFMFYLMSCDFFLYFCSVYRNFLFLRGVALLSGLVSPDIALILLKRELGPARVI